MTQAELEAMKLLAENHRLFVLIVPEDKTEQWMKKMTIWSNFVLDTGLLPPMIVPAVEKGDGLACPYCGSLASQNIEIHAKDCEWREAIGRWAVANYQIEQESK